MLRFIFGLLVATAFNTPLVYAQWSELSLEIPDSRVPMPTQVYVPDLSDAPSEKLSLIVHLHGCLQSAEDLKLAANWRKTADQENFILAMPDVPQGGVYAGCWDYYNEDHTKKNRHNIYLLSLIDEMLSRYPQIDPEHVYFSGLSSGAGQSVVLACLAPEKIAGIFVVAAPTLGSSARDLRAPNTDQEEVSELCLKLSGRDQKAFSSQRSVFIYDPRDYVVHADHNRINARAFSDIFQAKTPQEFSLEGLPGVDPEGYGKLFYDQSGPRLSVIEHHGLGHNWPAGSEGPKAPFISSQGLNFPAYIAQFLSQAGSEL